MMLANFGNYLFHFLMARTLGPVDYGVLESLISLLYFLGVPLSALSLVIVKYVSGYKGERRYGAIGKFFWILNKVFFLGGLGFFFAFLLLIPFLKSFLHLQQTSPLIIIAAIGFTGLFININRSFLQGTLKFAELSFVSISETFCKLFLAGGLVFLGLKINGAVAAILISGILAYFFSYFFLKKAVKKINLKENLHGREILNYFLPVFFGILALTSFYTSDIILARHFLPAKEAGFYAALAVLGKIIFFVSSPIISVMFPLISEKQTEIKKHGRFFFQSLILVGFICLSMSALYFLFPDLIIGLLFGKEFLESAKYLYLFAVFLSLYSLCALLINFYLAIKKTRIIVLPILTAMIQIILILFFHQNIVQFVWISIIVHLLLFISLMLYYSLLWKKPAVFFQ